ncbi:hypothetical protein R5L37_14730 [Acinetobacter pittii]|uniref:hypothetical protein n=1 Tax=Acinetobacter pittii TaxID=48296 RepID=UPI0029540750|nr:hypothetical protein [Acinetobacter pittii]MDV8153015.1 hypothetical protein [Acinetobacter pittii]
MEPILYAEELANYQIHEINEAETRKKYIDHTFFKIFTWPECRITFEDHTDSGFIDYKFLNSNEKTVMILEAKKLVILFYCLPILMKKNLVFSYH